MVLLALPSELVDDMGSDSAAEMCWLRRVSDTQSLEGDC